MLPGFLDTIFRKPRPFAAVKKIGKRERDQAINSLRSKLSWENHQVKSFVAGLDISGFPTCFKLEHLQRIIKNNQNTIIFSLVSKEYIIVGENWARHMSALRLSNYVIFCGDHESYEYLTMRDIPCIELKLPDVTGRSVNASGFDPKGLMMASLKFPICGFFLENGYNVIFSDIDAFWLKNPIDYLEKSDHDFAFQNTYFFPSEVIKLWGFTCCSGYFFVRCSEQGLDLIRSSQQFVDEICDDQVALNMALIKKNICWQYGEPELVKSKFGNALRVFWQGTRSGYGIFSPVKGLSFDGELTVTCLPQNMFRRHMFLDLSFDDIYVLHPNSPKSEKGKLEIFHDLGISINRKHS